MVDVPDGLQNIQPTPESYALTTLNSNDDDKNHHSFNTNDYDEIHHSFNTNDDDKIHFSSSAFAFVAINYCPKIGRIGN
jgi:hypothetical protein